MIFRNDINGLRAIAIIAVLIFHFEPNLLPGGYAGVDVFFVISGYLMTKIIFQGIERKEFNLLRFYIARVNRILPSLIILCLSVGIFGWFNLNPIEYKKLMLHISQSLAFVSNIGYWHESGYFDNASTEKWLLHTWSLSVEWQFYIIFPACMLLFNKAMNLKKLKICFVVFSIASFIFCIVATEKWPDASYYLLPTRAWEMMVGGIGYFYPIMLKKTTAKKLEIFGLLLIIVSFFMFDSNDLWPGYLALVPVLGAYFVIISCQNESKLTNNIVFKYIGLWSYSIYLWHWPLVVYGKYYNVENWSLVGIILSIILGVISFNLIEGHISKNMVGGKVKISFIVLLLPLIISFTGYVYNKNGLVERFDQEKREILQSAQRAVGDWNYPKPNLNISKLYIRYIDNKSDKNILFIGASHIEQVYPYVSKLKIDYNVYFLTMGGCFVTPSMKHPQWECSNIQNYKVLLESVRFEKIVTSFYNFNSYLPKDGLLERAKEYDEFLLNIKNHAQEVFLITGEPKGKNFDPKLAVRFDLNDVMEVTDIRKEYGLHEHAISKLQQLDGVEIIDPIKYLCPNGYCKTRDENNEFYYKDRDHMRPWYAEKSAKYLDEIFQ